MTQYLHFHNRSIGSLISVKKKNEAKAKSTANGFLMSGLRGRQQEEAEVEETVKLVPLLD